jgi:hypothetical protein
MHARMMARTAAHAHSHLVHRRSIRLCLAALALALVGASAAEVRAHPLHDEGIYAALVGVDAAAQGTVGLRILLVNNTPGAATLRGLSAPGSGPIALDRRRSLFGIEFLQPVAFLRIESGRRVLLAAPGYAVTAEALDLDAVIRGEIAISADFGPLGVLPLEVVGAPQTTE